MLRALSNDRRRCSTGEGASKSPACLAPLYTFDVSTACCACMAGSEKRLTVKAASEADILSSSLGCESSSCRLPLRGSTSFLARGIGAPSIDTSDALLASSANEILRSVGATCNESLASCSSLSPRLPRLSWSCVLYALRRGRGLGCSFASLGLHAIFSSSSAGRCALLADACFHGDGLRRDDLSGLFLRSLGAGVEPSAVRGRLDPLADCERRLTKEGMSCRLVPGLSARADGECE